MDTLEKIDKLNEACDNTLSFTRYNADWQVGSYRDGSPLHIDNRYPYIGGKTLKECVDRAYTFVFEKKK